MTPRAQVLAALRFESVRPVPMTIYETKLPQCSAERELRDNGLCLVRRGVQPYRTLTPNITSRQEVYLKDGRQFTRTIIETPAGTLTGLREAAGFTSWRHEYYFKSEADYPALLALIRDERYEPAYERFAEAERKAGEDVILRAAVGSEPLQFLMSGPFMNMETFCLEWMDNRERILELYEALVENRRKVYPLIAESPATHANYGGNLTPEIVSPEMYREYFLPHYAEAHEVLSKGGVLLGSHYDAKFGHLTELIGTAKLDYIEAFTPPPEGDLSLAEARAAWPEKALWLNFPSSLHLKTDDELEEAVVQMLDELDSTDGVIVGVTEDIPEDRWRDSLRALQRGILRQGR